jgi:hypothetical protein
MKDKSGKLLAMLGISMLVGASALAQPYPNETWTVDENGPALLQGPSLVGYSNGTNKLDLVSGLVGWYYFLGAPSMSGDVLLLEPGPTGTNYSDLLRFDGTGGVYFFSDLEPGEVNPDHADVPFLPSPAGSNVVVLAEIGPEGNNGAFYTPQPGQPGYDTSGLLPGLSYNIISDTLVVPEPHVAILAVTGGGLLLATRARRRRV